MSSNRVCSVAGCTNVVECRGFCNKHYHRDRRSGDPEGKYDPYRAAPDRFWSYVDATGDCWDWIGGKSRLRYRFWRLLVTIWPCDLTFERALRALVARRRGTR